MCSMFKSAKDDSLGDNDKNNEIIVLTYCCDFDIPIVLKQLVMEYLSFQTVNIDEIELWICMETKMINEQKKHQHSKNIRLNFNMFLSLIWNQF